MNMRFRIEPADRVILFGRKFRVKSQDELGFVLAELDRPGQTDRLSFEDFADLLNTPDLRIERGYFSQTNRKIEALHGSTCVLAWISEKERKKVIWRKCCCNSIRELHGKREVVLTEDSLDLNRSKLRALAEELFGREYLESCTTAPNDVSIPKFYCSSGLLRWLRKYKRANYAIEALISKDYKSGNRTKRFSEEEEALAWAAIEIYADTQKPCLSEAINGARRQARRENLRRKTEGKEILKVPSFSTVYRRVSAVGPYFLSAKRNGIDAANREFAFVEQGLDVKLPLERVEVDENKLDIISLFTVTGLIDNIPVDRRREIEKSRRWLYLFIDCATRCILSLRLAASQSADEAIRGLRDALRNKTHIARAHGCEAAWDMFGRLLCIIADHGTAFTSQAFQDVCAAIGCCFEHAPMRLPHLRGTNESSFKYLGQNLFSRTPGRTFHNTIVRGDYPAERLACLTDDELLGLVIKLYVDAYHHSPHSGLNGESPAEAWERLSGEGLVPAPPDGHEIRAAFGRKFERTLNKYGITWQSIHYSCPELRDAYLHSPIRKVNIRVDLEDIGWISVELGGKTFPARANWDTFNGMSYSEWDATRREIRKKHSKNAELNQAIVDDAYARIDKTIRQSMLRIDGTPFHVTDEEVDRNEQSMRVTLREQPEIDEVTPLQDLICPPEKPVDPMERGKFITPSGPRKGGDDEDSSDQPPTAKRRNWRFDDE